MGTEGSLFVLTISKDAHTRVHLSPDDLADRWRSSVGSLSNQRSAGAGPAFLKLGAKVLYPLNAVEAYEAARLVVTT
jgi:hypothetical protein